MRDYWLIVRSAHDSYRDVSIHSMEDCLLSLEMSAGLCSYFEVKYSKGSYDLFDHFQKHTGGTNDRSLIDRVSTVNNIVLLLNVSVKTDVETCFLRNSSISFWLKKTKNTFFLEGISHTYFSIPSSTALLQKATA